MTAAMLLIQICTVECHFRVLLLHWHMPRTQNSFPGTDADADTDTDTDTDTGSTPLCSAERHTTGSATKVPF